MIEEIDKRNDSIGAVSQVDLRHAVYWHPACEKHDIPQHPEQPARVSSILEALHVAFGYEDGSSSVASFREAERATEAQVLLFHHKKLVNRLNTMFQRAVTLNARTNKAAYEPLDGGDTVIMEHTGEAVYRAAGAAVQAIDHLFADKDDPSHVHSAFCCVRPPGHHAEPNRAMGFCFFNNVGIAAEYARERYHVRRIAILDFDVHHGNGTDDYAAQLFHYYQQQQNNNISDVDKSPVKKGKSPQKGHISSAATAYTEDDLRIFNDIMAQHTNHEDIYPLFYASTHEKGAFPGTGPELPVHRRSELHRFVVNRWLPSGKPSRAAFRVKWQEIIDHLVEYDPELIIFSAGFDAHDEDPLADVELTEEDYTWCTTETLNQVHQHRLRKRAQQNDGNQTLSPLLPVPVLSVLEGGYDLEAIASSTVAHWQAVQDTLRSQYTNLALSRDELQRIGASEHAVTEDVVGDEVRALQESLRLMGIRLSEEASAATATSNTAFNYFPEDKTAAEREIEEEMRQFLGISASQLEVAAAFDKVFADTANVEAHSHVYEEQHIANVQEDVTVAAPSDQDPEPVTLDTDQCTEH